MELRGKKLLVLTGSNGADDIIAYAKKSGVETVATDYYQTSTVKNMADHQYSISTTDIDGLRKIALKHNVDGITTGTSESSMFSILNLSKELGLPFYATANQLDSINDKKKFKDLLRKHGVPVIPEYNYSGSHSEAELRKIDFPVVVKPVDSSGAKGISSCRNKEELIKAFDYALEFSRKRKILVEKCLKGLPEVFFNYTIVDGEFSLSCGFDRHINYDQDGLLGLPIAYLLPSEKLQVFNDTIHPKIVAALKSIGIKNGTMSIQCFVDGDQFYIFEAGYRIGGGQMYVFTKELNGISVLEMMVNFALTGKMAEDTDVLKNDNPFFKKPCCQLNIPLKPGKISVLEGVEDVRNMKGVLNITEVHKLGDVIKNDGSIGQLCLRIHIIGETKEDLADIIKKINSTLSILDENGNDMFLEKYSYDPHTSFYG